MIKTIIFDFDGTIADTFHSSIEIINSLANKYGYRTFENEEIEQSRSKSMRDILKERHIPFVKLPFFLNDFTTLAQKTILSQHPIRKIPQLLQELNGRGFDLYIISSNSVENVSIFLHKYKLTRFKGIYSGKSLFGKNIIISRLLKKYQIDSEDAIYVGDEIRDIEAAHKAKIKIISVAWGFNTEEALNRNSPDYLVNLPKQISDLLGKINSIPV